MPCKTLNIAVDFVKRRARYIQSAKRRIQVEAGNRRNVGFFALGLCENKPIGTETKCVACPWLCCFLLRVVCVCGSFEWHRHAKGDSCLPFAYLPFALKPTAIGVEWPGLQIAADALFQRKQGVPEAECELPDYVNWGKNSKVACIFLRSRVNIVRPVSRTLVVCEMNRGLQRHICRRSFSAIDFPGSGSVRSINAGALGQSEAGILDHFAVLAVSRKHNERDSWKNHSNSDDAAQRLRRLVRTILSCRTVNFVAPTKI